MDADSPSGDIARATCRAAACLAGKAEGHGARDADQRTGRCR